MLRKFAKLSILFAIGLTLSSCGFNDIVNTFYDQSDDFLAKIETDTIPKSTQEKGVKLAQAMANPSKTLANVDISKIAPDLQNCYKEASVMSGIPLQVMYAITMNETGFRPNEICKNGSLTNWDCGIMQANTKSNICPFSYYANVKPWSYFSRWNSLYNVAKQLGLTYGGGMVDPGSQECQRLTPSLTKDFYCPLVQTSHGSKGVCLGVFLGAIELSKCYYWIYSAGITSYTKIPYKVYAKASPDMRKWLPVAFCYNGLGGCKGKDKFCYVERFIRHLTVNVRNFLKKKL